MKRLPRSTEERRFQRVCCTITASWTQLILPGIANPTTVSPSSFVTPYSPLKSDEAEAALELKEGEAIKIQLGAQIDGFGTVVCDTIIIPSADSKNGEITGREADLLLATHYATELLLRLMVPPGLLATGTDEEKAKAAKIKAPSTVFTDMYLNRLHPRKPRYPHKVQGCRSDLAEGVGGCYQALRCWREDCDHLRAG